MFWKPITSALCFLFRLPPFAFRSSRALPAAALCAAASASMAGELDANNLNGMD
jgi:hypothetical protein